LDDGRGPETEGPVTEPQPRLWPGYSV
jgi:hypothetical protein